MEECGTIYVGWECFVSNCVGRLSPCTAIAHMKRSGLESGIEKRDWVPLVRFVSGDLICSWEKLLLRLVCCFTGASQGRECDVRGWLARRPDVAASRYQDLLEPKPNYAGWRAGVSLGKYSYRGSLVRPAADEGSRSNHDGIKADLYQEADAAGGFNAARGRGWHGRGIASEAGTA